MWLTRSGQTAEALLPQVPPPGGRDPDGKSASSSGESTGPVVAGDVPATPSFAGTHAVADPGVTEVQAAAIGDRKVEVRAESPVTVALGGYGRRLTDAIDRRVFLQTGEGERRVSALGGHLAALLRQHAPARSRDWLTPALQATQGLHPTHREQALQQLLRPALSSTLSRSQRQAALDSIARSLAGADTESQRVTFAALVQLMAMGHRDPADALALLEVARGFRTGIAYDAAALLVGAALRPIPDGPVPALAPVVRAVLALLDADNRVVADDEPIVNLGIELGRQARGPDAQDRLQVLLEGVGAVAGGLRPDQLWELARGCLSGLGGTQIDPAQRDAWLAGALRLDETLSVPALHGLWEGVALGLLVDGAPTGGASGALEVPQLRSHHLGALVDAILERAGHPLKAAAIAASAAAATNKLHDGPGTLGDLLQRVAGMQSRLPIDTAFLVGCALARGCWAVKDSLEDWERARKAAGPSLARDDKAQGPVPLKEAKSGASAMSLDIDDAPGRHAQPLPARDLVGLGWRFVREPDSLVDGSAWAGSPSFERVTLAWSLPGVPSEMSLPQHLTWLSRARLLPGQRGALAAQLQAKIGGASLRRLFPPMRDVLLQACAEARAEPVPVTGQRTALLHAMNEVLLAYDQWLSDPHPLDARSARDAYAEMATRKDLPPDLRLMILERLAVHLAETKAGIMAGAGQAKLQASHDA